MDVKRIGESVATGTMGNDTVAHGIIGAAVKVVKEKVSGTRCWGWSKMFRGEACMGEEGKINFRITFSLECEVYIASTHK